MATPPNTPEKFWARVSRSDGCWLWNGCRRADGYGKVSWHGESVLAHRLAYELAHGPFDASLFVCHRCDNPACVRPDHLFLGQHADNMADMRCKGRGTNPVTHGEANASAKLTWEQVDEIRSEHQTGRVSQRALARRFGVDRRTIKDVLIGRTWRRSAA